MELKDKLRAQFEKEKDELEKTMAEEVSEVISIVVAMLHSVDSIDSVYHLVSTHVATVSFCCSVDYAKHISTDRLHHALYCKRVMKVHIQPVC